MKIHLFFEGFNNAIEGIIYVLKTQKNMRFHFIAGFVVLIVSIFMGLDSREYLFLCCAIGLVLFAEMINTAIELTIDLIGDAYHPLARVAKDVAAGAVFIAALFAVVVAYLVLSPHFVEPIQIGIHKIKTSPWHLSFIALILVITLTILAKLFLHRGTPLHGGMPSGHSAIAFSIWTIASLVSGSPLIVILVFILASIVAFGRFFQKVHTFYEVLVGAGLGIIATLLVFQVYTTVTQ
ncbi:MAG: diacylglycerol kinase [Candidatus Ancaeobacter aquaticus]|nr:diacylglycerol kinase [Candidatus Ancaeobacter aquaticus]